MRRETRPHGHIPPRTPHNPNPYHTPAPIVYRKPTNKTKSGQRSDMFWPPNGNVFGQGRGGNGRGWKGKAERRWWEREAEEAGFDEGDVVIGSGKVDVSDKVTVVQPAEHLPLPIDIIGLIGADDDTNDEDEMMDSSPPSAPIPPIHTSSLDDSVEWPALAPPPSTSHSTPPTAKGKNRKNKKRRARQPQSGSNEEEDEDGWLEEWEAVRSDEDEDEGRDGKEFDAIEDMGVFLWHEDEEEDVVVVDVNVNPQ